MILEDKRKRDEMNHAISKELVLTTDDSPPLLGDSIFLRYLPVPFIKYLYENQKNDQKFLEIYRRHDYRHPRLIWNQSMRNTLEDKIKNNARKFLSDLREFAHDRERYRVPAEIPIFERSVNEIVKYEQIEKEVRCGRYYLGVWTSLESPKKIFTIDEEEEKEFH